LKPAFTLRESAPSIPTCHPLPALCRASKNAQPLKIHPEDGNYNVCRSVG
jgi:hypothetical protein